MSDRMHWATTTRLENNKPEFMGGLVTFYLPSEGKSVRELIGKLELKNLDPKKPFLKRLEYTLEGKDVIINVMLLDKQSDPSLYDKIYFRNAQAHIHFYDLDNKFAFAELHDYHENFKKRNRASKIHLVGVTKQNDRTGAVIRNMTKAVGYGQTYKLASVEYLSDTDVDTFKKLMYQLIK